MKVILVNNSKSDIGGTVTYTASLLKYLKKNKIKVRLLTSEKPMGDLRFVFKLFFKKKPRGKLVHAQLPIYAAPFVFRKRNKVVVTLHGDNIRAIRRKRGRFTGSFYSILEGYALKRADAIIAVDRSTKDVYLEKYPDLKIEVIPVGIDLRKFKLLDKAEVRKKYNLDGLLILNVGRIRKDKGIILLINAFKIVKTNRPDAHLVLVGTGKDEAKFKEMAKQVSDILFLGHLPNSRIPEIMNAADVFVLGSLYESGPLVVQEALACGVPCVVTDVGRVREFIKNDDCGRIVERDENALAKAILEVVNMGDVRSECRRAAEEFGFERTASETINLYKSMIKRPK